MCIVSCHKPCEYGHAAMVCMSELLLRSRKFDSLLFHYHVMTVGGEVVHTRALYCLVY